MDTTDIDTVIIGAGQAGLSTGYHLKQKGIPFVILDSNTRLGDNWRRQWDSLKLYLGEPLGSDLEHFCAVHYGAPEINVIREAVRTFIDDRLARDPELKKRFDKVQQDHTEKQSQESSKPSSGISTRPSGIVLPYNGGVGDMKT